MDFIDEQGFRANVGIILTDGDGRVLIAGRRGRGGWQFPQGGIQPEETTEGAMFRELHEEVGLSPDHVRVVARTRDWLRYEVPTHFIRRDARGHYRGQKQIWFLLQLTGRDTDMNLRATDHPEFDAWRWNEYWIPLDVVIEFKRDVYQMALTELARFLPRGAQHNRYLRSGLRPHHREDATDHYRRSDALPAASPARASLATTPMEGTPTAPAPLSQPLPLPLPLPKEPMA